MGRCKLECPDGTTGVTRWTVTDTQKIAKIMSRRMKP